MTEMQNNRSPMRHTLRFLDEVEQIQGLVCAQMEAKDFSSQDVFSVRLALDESLTNAITHGNAEDPQKEVRIQFHVDDEHVWIEIEDQGDGFRLSDVPDPTKPERLDQPNGRGLHVMRAFMCSVEYNEQGNRVTMRKQRTEVAIEPMVEN